MFHLLAHSISNDVPVSRELAPIKPCLDGFRNAYGYILDRHIRSFGPLQLHIQLWTNHRAKHGSISRGNFRWWLNSESTRASCIDPSTASVKTTSCKPCSLGLAKAYHQRLFTALRDTTRQLACMRESTRSPSSALPRTSPRLDIGHHLLEATFPQTVYAQPRKRWTSLERSAHYRVSVLPLFNRGATSVHQHHIEEVLDSTFNRGRIRCVFRVACKSIVR